MAHRTLQAGGWRRRQELGSHPMDKLRLPSLPLHKAFAIVRRETLQVDQGWFSLDLLRLRPPPALTIAQRALEQSTTVMEDHLFLAKKQRHRPNLR